MNIQFLTDGNLEMSLTRKEQRLLKKCFPADELQSYTAEAIFIGSHLEPLGYKKILPENCGALTAATLITDGKDVWGDMSYQVQSFLEELVKGKKVIWTKG